MTSLSPEVSRGEATYPPLHEGDPRPTARAEVTPNPLETFHHLLSQDGVPSEEPSTRGLELQSADWGENKGSRN